MTRGTKNHGLTLHRLQVQIAFTEPFHKSDVLPVLQKAEDALGPVASLEGCQSVLRDGSIHDAIYAVAGSTTADARRSVLNAFESAALLDDDLRRLRMAVQTVASRSHVPPSS